MVDAWRANTFGFVRKRARRASVLVLPHPSKPLNFSVADRVAGVSRGRTRGTSDIEASVETDEPNGSVLPLLRRTVQSMPRVRERRTNTTHGTDCSQQGETKEKPTVMPNPPRRRSLIQQLTAQDFANDREAFARLITEMRERASLSTAALARQLGIKPSSLK